MAAEVRRRRRAERAERAEPNRSFEYPTDLGKIPAREKRQGRGKTGNLAISSTIRSQIIATKLQVAISGVA